jgi:hypothetical protein
MGFTSLLDSDISRYSDSVMTGQRFDSGNGIDLSRYRVYVDFGLQGCDQQMSLYCIVAGVGFRIQGDTLS